MRGTFLKCVGGVLVVLVACSNPPPPARADGSVAFDAPTDVPDGAAPDADVASLIEEDRTAPLDIPQNLRRTYRRKRGLMYHRRRTRASWCAAESAHSARVGWAEAGSPSSTMASSTRAAAHAQGRCA